MALHGSWIDLRVQCAIRNRTLIPHNTYCVYARGGLFSSRFFIGYWILIRGWIFILALFYFHPRPGMASISRLRGNKSTA
jgi:hypothetical protein